MRYNILYIKLSCLILSYLILSFHVFSHPILSILLLSFLIMSSSFLTCHLSGKALSVVVAAGPFTTSLNLEYEPLRDLLMEALTSQPDVLILTGPFVDITQPLLKTGEIYLSAEDDEGRVTGSHSASYEMVFIEKVIRDCFSALYNSNPDLPTHIILVPSLLDAHHEFVYPQPAFGDRDEVQSEMFVEAFGVLKVPNSKNGDVRKRVHLLPNPCMFR